MNTTFVKVGFEFIYNVASPTPMAFIVRPRDVDIHRLLSERREITPEIPIHEYVDSFGNHVWRFTAPAGSVRLWYDALTEVPVAPDPKLLDIPGTFVSELPDDVLMYTLPSRYVPSDLVIDDAWRMFGHAPDGWQRVQAICDWLKNNITYGYGSSDSSTSGYDAYQNRRAVCRDFAHMGVMFCRAMNIPARYVYGFLPDVGVPPDPTPMDFHAWFEAYLGGAWRTFDARHNYPRAGRVLIGRGRDAVDTALTTSYGPAQLQSMIVWADEVAAPQTTNTVAASQKLEFSTAMPATP